MTSPPHWFAFERANDPHLEFIPLCVRFQLDRIGCRISLRAWQSLSADVRAGLVDADLDEPGGRAFEARLTEALPDSDERPREPEPIDAAAFCPPADRLPAAVVEHFALAGFNGPPLPRWAGLSPLQRFALVKLTRRPGKLSHDFRAACTDFGLLD